MHFLTQTGGSARGAGGWMIRAALLLAAAAAPAQQQADPRGVKLDEVQITLDPLRAEWILGEPVFVYLHVLNRATRDGKPVEISCRANFDFSEALTLKYSYNDRAPRQYQNHRSRSSTHVPAINFTVPAGGYWSYLLTICHDVDYINHPGGFAFERPGEYSLSGALKLEINNQRCSRNLRPSKITIKAPRGVDADIYRKTLHRPVFAKAMQLNLAQDGTTFSAFNEIATKHPNSAYYPIAQLCLARYELKKFKYKSALKRCQKILRHKRRSIPLERTLYLQADCALGLGDTNLLYDSLLALWSDNPGCFLISKYSRLYRDYLIGPHPEMVRLPWYFTE